MHSLTARLFASFISISTLPFSPSRPSSRSSVDSLPCGETGSLKADRIALDRGTARAGCLAGSNVCEAEIAGDRDCPRWSGFEHCLSLRLVIHLSEDQATFAPAEGPFAVIYRSYASNHVRYVTENTAVHSEAARSHLDPLLVWREHTQHDCQLARTPSRFGLSIPTLDPVRKMPGRYLYMFAVVLHLAYLELFCEDSF